MLISHNQESWSYFPIPCYGEGEKENSREEPISEARAEHDIGGRDLDDVRLYPHRLPNLQKFSRRKKGQPACAMPPCQSLSPTPAPSPVSDSSADSSGNEPSLLVSDNLDAPIAHRKGVRQCTQHPISQFVSYDCLSPSYRAFVSSLSSISIPQNWQDAFMIPKWKGAMVEEMTTLKKNGT